MGLAIGMTRRLRGRLARVRALGALWYSGRRALASLGAPVPPPAAQDGDGRQSGPHWVHRFPRSASTADLALGFGAGVERFLEALRDAGATVRVSCTYRPPERAYLMHYAFRIACDGLDPREVPPFGGVGICWAHRHPDGAFDPAASQDAARRMVAAYNIAYRPVLDSQHSEGRAVDMNIFWRGSLTITDAEGRRVLIAGEPRTGQNAGLQRVAASYGVMKCPEDPPHWSDDGRF